MDSGNFHLNISKIVLLKCIRKEGDILKSVYFLSMCDTGKEQIHFVIQKEMVNLINGSQVAVRFPRPCTNIWITENLQLGCSLALSHNPVIRKNLKLKTTSVKVLDAQVWAHGQSAHTNNCT